MHLQHKPKNQDSARRDSVNKEIFFLAQIPVTKRDYERFGVSLLLARGFSVKFLDMTKVLNPLYPADEQGDYISGYCDVTFAKTRQDIVRFLKDNRKAFAIDLVGARYDNIFIYRALRKYGIQYAAFCSNTIPSPGLLTRNLLERAIAGTKRIKKMSDIPEIFRQFVFNILPDKVLGFNTPRFILANATRFARRRPYPDRDTEIIYGHTLDYDLYLDFVKRKPQPLISEEYIIFLDEYFPLHPDIKTKNFPDIYSSSDDYYTELNAAFHKLEEALKMPVVIAAHPRSQYEKRPDLFGNRRLIKGRTVELVAHSRYALTHGSTAINFAVLFEKPIIFLMPLKARGTYYERLISNFTSELKQPFFDVDSITEDILHGVLTINRNTYAGYKENYIKKSGTPERYFWDIVADRIYGVAEVSDRNVEFETAKELILK